LKYTLQVLFEKGEKLILNWTLGCYRYLIMWLIASLQWK